MRHFMIALMIIFLISCNQEYLLFQACVYDQVNHHNLITDQDIADAVYMCQDKTGYTGDIEEYLP